jgi:hypothetical protein
VALKLSNITGKIFSAAREGFARKDFFFIRNDDKLDQQLPRV